MPRSSIFTVIPLVTLNWLALATSGIAQSKSSPKDLTLPACNQKSIPSVTAIGAGLSGYLMIRARRNVCQEPLLVDLES